MLNKDYSDIIDTISKKKLDEYVNRFPQWKSTGLILLTTDNINMELVVNNFAKKIFDSGKIKKFITPIFCADYFNSYSHLPDVDILIKGADLRIFHELAIAGSLDFAGKEKLSRVVYYCCKYDKKFVFTAHHSCNKLEELLGFSLSSFITQNAVLLNLKGK